MIELPNFATMAVASPSFVDAGFTQRGIGSIARIDRKGSRYRIGFAYGPFRPDKARVIVSRLVAAKAEGVRVPFPLQVSQGSPGAPVMDGANQLAKEIDLRGMTPGYFCKEGYWLSIENASGQHFLHNVKTGGRVAADGTLTITLNELPRDTFADGATVHLAKPYVEGLLEGDTVDWDLSADMATPFSFVIEETR